MKRPTASRAPAVGTAGTISSSRSRAKGARYMLSDALNARTPVPGLFLTGQDVMTPEIAEALAGGPLWRCSNRSAYPPETQINKRTGITFQHCPPSTWPGPRWHLLHQQLFQSTRYVGPNQQRALRR